MSHLYGLTETHGPGTYCTWKPEWDALPLEERYRMKARQVMQHIALDKGFDVDAQEIIKFPRDHLPHYMAPWPVIFEDLPRTSTGKVQKFIPRDRAKALGSLSLDETHFL